MFEALGDMAARNTARVLSAINPHYIRSRPLVPRPGTPLFDDVAQGRLTLSSPHERLEELAWMIGGLEVSSRVCFDHAMNAWRDRRGGLLFRQDCEGYRFPEEKPLVLERIREGLAVGESMHVHVRELMAAHAGAWQIRRTMSDELADRLCFRLP